MTASLFVLEVMAAYRLTTLVTSDDLTVGWRRRIGDRYPPLHDGDRVVPHPLVVLVNCGRCVGVWASAVVTSVCALTGIAAGGSAFVLVLVACAGSVSLLVSVAP